MAYRGSYPVMMQPGVMLTTHVHLVLRLRMSGDIPLRPCVSSWREQGQIYPSTIDQYTGLSPHAGNIDK